VEQVQEEEPMTTNDVFPVIALTVLAFGPPSCNESGPDDDADASTDADTDSDTDTGTECVTGTYDGVDLLIMIENDGGMHEEQLLLAGAMFTLVDALLHGEGGYAYDAIDSMRVAVVTSNMGISYGEDQEIPDDEIVPPSLLQASAHCTGTGDDGEFQSIEVDAIVEPDAGTIGCPALATAYAETSTDAPNADIAAQAACLTQQGTAGCGFEQQLQSAAVALRREDQQSFLVASHVLAVLFVTNEDDCSMLDAPGLFATEEAQDATKLNLACYLDTDHELNLFTPAYFYEKYTAAKGEASAVVLAAITGVPWADEDPVGAAACEGRGEALGGCLGQDGMQRVPVEDTSTGTGIWKFENACARSEGGSFVTTAMPCRRFVKLANEYFGANSYVSSICNDDWTPAMIGIADLIGERIAEACQ
jgi:hypothetical protein